MTGFSVSAVLALVGGALVLLAGFVPYVAWSYRRRGRFGLGHAFLVACTAVYAVALWTYTVLPLPDPQVVCLDPASPQLRPLQFVTDLTTAVRSGLPAGPVVAQVALNVLLFVPLGMVAHHLFRLRLPATALLGLGVSGLIELTQLTGNWGLYPCPYRLMDVDDLIANTSGAVLGFALAPALRLVPDQRVSDVGVPGPVTGGRRVLGMVADVLLVQTGALVVWLPVGWALLATGAMSRVEVADATALRTGLGVFVAALLLVGVPLLGRGATVGQRLVLLRPQTEGGSVPSVGQRLVRAGVGSGGYFVLDGAGALTGWALLDTMAWLLGVASLVVATRGDHRGLSGTVARLRVVDDRLPRVASTDAERWAAVPELRRLANAVVVGGILLHLVLLLLLGLLDRLAERGHPGAVWVLVGAVALGSLALLAFLVLNGVAMARREGRSLGNLLTLLLGLGLLGLAAVTVLTVLDGRSLPAVVLGSVWVLVAYLGFVFWAFVLYGLLYARRDATPGADSVVVLGSGLLGSRVPPLLAARLDRGRAVLDAELARGGRAVLVCSGGQGPGEDVPEGVAMADYLVAAGVDPALLRRETASTTTEENLRLSIALLEAEGRGGRVVVVTNDYHAFRAAIITRELGLTAQVVGAPTASYFLPSAILREFVGLLARNPWPHLVVAVVIVVTATVGARLL